MKIPIKDFSCKYDKTIVSNKFLFFWQKKLNGSFWAIRDLFRLTTIFPKNLIQLVFRINNPLVLYKKSEKTTEPILWKTVSRQNDGNA